MSLCVIPVISDGFIQRILAVGVAGCCQLERHIPSCLDGEEERIIKRGILPRPLLHLRAAGQAARPCFSQQPTCVAMNKEKGKMEGRWLHEAHHMPAKKGEERDPNRRTNPVPASYHTHNARPAIMEREEELPTAFIYKHSPPTTWLLPFLHHNKRTTRSCHNRNTIKT